jgi:hypothetical protein
LDQPFFYQMVISGKGLKKKFTICKDDSLLNHNFFSENLALFLDDQQE